MRATVPADAATDFPTDGTIRVFLTGGFPAALRSAIGAEYRLRDAAGALVPLHAQVTETRLDLVPRAPLSASSRYALERVYAYDASGHRVSDTERMGAARSQAPSPLRGACDAVIAPPACYAARRNSSHPPQEPHDPVPTRPTWGRYAAPASPSGGA